MSATDELTLPGPAWRLKKMLTSKAGTTVIYQYTTFRTNEELMIWKFESGYVAQLTSTEGKDVTRRLPQERWDQIYSKAIAAHALLGRTPEIIEEIF